MSLTVLQINENLWLHLAAALGIGLLIGLERERRKELGALRVSAGIRTFAITSLLGAAAELVGGDSLLIALSLGLSALVAVAYWRSPARDTGVTTGVALLITLVLGGLALRDSALAGALGVTISILLASRSSIHNFVRKVISASEVSDGLMLLAATLVVLPMMPDRYLGPLQAFNPRTTWLLVVLMMAVGAVGHVTQRLLGANLGLAAAGLASGFISSIATIASMGESAVRTPALMRPAVAGAVLSTVSTVILMVLLLAGTSMSTLAQMALPLLCAGVAASLYAVVFTFRTLHQPDATAPAAGHAFNLRTALGLAVLFSAITMASAALQAWFGETGLRLGAALAGFADTHAIAVAIGSLVVSGHLPADQAVFPILCALSTNTLTKAIVALVSGNRRFAAQVVPGLVLFVAASWLAFALIRH